MVETEDRGNLVEYLIRHQAKVPHVCYHEQLGPIQTCDAGVVEVDGELKRACATKIRAGMRVMSPYFRGSSTFPLRNFTGASTKPKIAPPRAVIPIEL